MWLMNYITNNSLSSPAAVKGELSTGSVNGTTVAASGEHKELALCFPYGVVSVPPAGESAVVLPLADGEVGLGVLSKGVGLEEGEVMLYSKGGASIVLKNDGRVLINGRVFDQ
jgi:hypothetical protein